MKLTATSVNRCIYCGSKSKLTDEHVVPFSFGGNMILPKASCDGCRKITESFERTVAREMYGRLRVRLNIPTRRPHRRPTEFPVIVDGAGGEREVMIPASLYPRLYQVFRFPVAGILTGQTPIDTNPAGVEVIYRGHREDIDTLREADYLSAGDTLKMRDTLSWGAFNRFLAKIAHAYAAFEIGLDGYEHYLPPLILGISPHFSHFVGGVEQESNVNYYLSLEISEIAGAQYIICKISLVWTLDPFSFPLYQVVVGKVLDKDVVTARARRSHLDG